ncbi:MAG: hypothetical protein QNJ12_00250 [Ilumatobacter sp.]|uniref:hypothetical protein n=1 Tax=Ilumatobacter sp. TaxID=1967498 RepID=UPI002606C817|nr:hypothetical protein [Ilumatobacter sp.]MDJ0767181.1 hypothetical protein [Ilumatobacter sp.]
MSSRLEEARRRFRSNLTERQQRGVRVLTWASIVCLVGVSVTGAWQFVTHESDPGWYGYEPGSDVRVAASPSEGVAELHGLFAAGVAVVALVGGAWFAYRVLYDIPWPAVVALLGALAGLITGSVIRFNLVKLQDREYDDAGRGYAQLFGGDVEFVVTDRWELGPMAIRLWTIGHVLTLPILLAVIWFGLPHADGAES